MARLPEAPGLLSTKTPCGNFCDSPSATHASEEIGDTAGRGVDHETNAAARVRLLCLRHTDQEAQRKPAHGSALFQLVAKLLRHFLAKLVGRAYHRREILEHLVRPAGIPGRGGTRDEERNRTARARGRCRDRCPCSPARRPRAIERQCVEPPRGAADRQDPAADNTDLYAFVSPDKPDTVTLIANYIPLEEPAGGPELLRVRRRRRSTRSRSTTTATRRTT